LFIKAAFLAGLRIKIRTGGRILPVAQEFAVRSGRPVAAAFPIQSQTRRAPAGSRTFSLEFEGVPRFRPGEGPAEFLLFKIIDIPDNPHYKHLNY
jgi:hypothetical protein